MGNCKDFIRLKELIRTFLRIFRPIYQLIISLNKLINKNIRIKLMQRGDLCILGLRRHIKYRKFRFKI